MSTEGTTPTAIPWKNLHAKATLVDLHAHPSLKVSLFRRSLSRVTGSSRHLWPPSFRTSLGHLRDGGVDLILSAVYAPEHGLRKEFWPIHLLRLLMPCRWQRYYEGPYFDVTLRMLDDIEDQIRKHGDFARKVSNPTELRALLAEPEGRPVAFVHCLEGAHCLDGNLDNLQALAKRGVAYLTLAHFYDNGFAPPCYPFDKKLDRPGLFDERRDPSRPLTPLGEQLVSALGEHGILTDVAHCTPVARRRVYELLGPHQGVIASHVGVQGIHPTPYNLTDDEIRTIADRGGVVGVIFMNQWLVPYETSHGLNEIVQTIRHLEKVGGVGCVAVGTDFDGFTDPPDDLKDARELPYLTCRLVAEGFTSTEIEAMLGGNALRTLLDHWRGA
jgi:membrane dipeptidase